MCECMCVYECVCMNVCVPVHVICVNDFLSFLSGSWRVNEFQASCLARKGLLTDSPEKGSVTIKP